MITIPQHGSAGELFDMNLFLSDVDALTRVDSWLVTIQECQGEGALAFEERTKNQTKISDAEFRREYRGIYQTIDGSFTALFEEKEQCRLDAIDSSYWEIYGSPEFEAHMLGKYGTYRYKSS